MRRIIAILMVVLAVGSMMADGKLSPWLRRAAQTAQPSSGMRRSAATDTMVTIAFIRISGDADAILAAHGGRSLARFGDIHIAMLPIGQLKALAALDAVKRIEARRPCSLLLDSTAMHVDALPVYAGRRLPHPLTGRGVVMGVMDIGFDLTHPSFYTADMSEYRIKALWDQLSIDTAGSELPVGADYVGREAIVDYGHTRDGLEQTHGTHTLGIAAGTGYDRPYRGMAYESDICLVANAVTEDVAFVDSADYYKYTSATDALGFKYIFDYAAAHGQPCVISFSEGTYPDLSGDDQLFFAVLDSLCGPGRIIVAAAGNRGHKLNYFHKLRGELSAGTYFDHDGTSVMFQLLADGPFDLRIVAHGEQNDTIVMPSRMFVALPDSEYIDTLALGRGHYSIDVAAYPSCYHPADSVYEVFLRAPFNIRRSGPLSIELIGDDTDVECFGINGNFANNAEAGPAFTVAESTHNVFSPGCAPAVICVGATSYRQAIVTLDSLRHTNGEGNRGERAAYSSVGPTIDGRCKPDVMAPGNYVISSFSSHYYEAKPDAWNIRDYGVDMSEFEGRSYPWAAIYGTSMAAPVVAGAIALWLEAKPDLTPAEVMETIAATARRPLPDMDYPNNLYGYGEIDVYRGLLHILGIDAIEGVSADSPMAISVAASPQPGTIALRLARQPRSEVSLRVYSLKGELLAVGRVPPSAGAGIVTIGVPSARGICVVQADSGDPAFRGSVVTIEH